MAKPSIREMLRMLSEIESGLPSAADLSEDDSDAFAEAVMLIDDLSATLVGGIRRDTVTASALGDALVILKQLRSAPLRDELTVGKNALIDSLEAHLRSNFGGVPGRGWGGGRGSRP